jgi:hypothetical protein
VSHCTEIMHFCYQLCAVLSLLTLFNCFCVAWCRCKEHCIVPTRMRQLGYAVQNLYGAVYSNLQGQPLHGGAAAVAGESAVQLSARFGEGCSALCAYHEWWFWGKV